MTTLANLLLVVASYVDWRTSICAPPFKGHLLVVVMDWLVSVYIVSTNTWIHAGCEADRACVNKEGLWEPWLDITVGSLCTQAHLSVGNIAGHGACV